jgi:hypothetical protein
LIALPLTVLLAVVSRGRLHPFATRGSLFQFPSKERMAILPADEVGGTGTAKWAKMDGDSIDALTEWDATSAVITKTRSVKTCQTFILDTFFAL